MFGFLIGSINLLIKALGGTLQLIFSVLPPSPFKILNNSVVAEFLPGLNYFVPVSEIITISEAWLVAVGAFYARQIVLRWLKAIE